VKLNIDLEMYKWVKDLFPINRSLTGDGNRETLRYIQDHLPDLKVSEIPSGTKAFDWEIPKEWRIREGWIADLFGRRIVDFSKCNLHVVGYSVPIDKIMSRDELDKHLFSLPEQPNAIPYVTSYYTEDFGFCLSQIERDNLGAGPFHVYIDSEKFNGSLTYGELVIPGLSEKEVVFSTYVCHPSMASNELSGPVIAIALAQHIYGIEQRRYTYRFLFTAETIGTIFYISKHLDQLKKNTVSGWVLTCMGDNKTYSYVPTRDGMTLTDLISRQVLSDLHSDYREYSWLDRGSDERQFNSPGVDLPVGSLMRSKYGEYPEYHTSLDDLTFVSPEGLNGSLTMMKQVVKILETDGLFKINTLCEPQLGKRGLYPTISTKLSGAMVRDLMNVISYLDGNNSLLQISGLCKISYEETLEILKQLNDAGLIEKV
jgi:aminopeptidase-like protein